MHHKNIVSLIAVSGLAVACAPGVSMGSITSPIPSALGHGSVYHQTSPPTLYHGGFFDVFVDLDFTIHGNVHAPGSGADNPPSTGEARITMPGLPPGTPVLLNGFIDYADVDDGSGGYNSLILNFGVTGGALPGGLGTFLIRESPTLVSTGHYAVAPIGGGLYQIDSFFDVFTEISLDNGATWLVPFNENNQPASSHFELVPAPGVGGAAAMLGFAVLRRRRR